MKSKYLDAMPALRAIAFLLIFLSHSTENGIRTGTIGVSIFLILGGFCATYSYLANPQKQMKSGIKGSFSYMLSHIGKLYELHIVTLLAVAAANMLHAGGGTAQRLFTLRYLPINALLLQSWFPNEDIYYSFNAVSWYLSVIVLCYLQFPTILSKMKRMNRKQMGLAAISVYAVSILVALVLAWILREDTSETADGFIYWFTYIFPLTRACDFLIGCFIGGVFYMGEDKQKNIKKKNAENNTKTTKIRYTVLEVVLIILAVLQVIFYDDFPSLRTIRSEIYWLPVCLGIVYLFAMKRGMLTNLCYKSKGLNYIGKLSAGLFLIHPIAIQFLLEFVPNMNTVILTVGSLVASIVGAWVWLWLEKKVKQLRSIKL